MSRGLNRRLAILEDRLTASATAEELAMQFRAFLGGGCTGPLPSAPQLQSRCRKASAAVRSLSGLYGEADPDALRSMTELFGTPIPGLEEDASEPGEAEHYFPPEEPKPLHGSLEHDPVVQDLRRRQAGGQVKGGVAEQLGHIFG
jgi:hypothetical protein